jgi:DNA primase
MCPLSSTTRSDSNGEVPGEAGDIAEAFTRKDHYQELINRANSVPLMKIFKHYHVRIDAYNRKTTCPFKNHKGGRENTPSFYYYPATNSFFCFGCRIGGEHVHGCTFVAEIDQITRVQAAHKILELFESDVDEDNIYDQKSLSERLEIMMDFSNAVHDFYQIYSDPKARVYIEVACKKYDTLNRIHKLDNDALRRTVEQMKKYIALYKP